MTPATCDLWDIWSEGWEDITTYLQTYPPTYLPNYLPTYMPIYLPPLEPPDNHQEPPDNRQEPEDFYFWYTTSEPETCSQLFLNLLNFSPTFSTFSQFFLNLFQFFLKFFSSIFSKKFQLVTIETLIKILTIENLNSWNLCYLTIKSDSGQHSQFFRCFWSSHFSPSLWSKALSL